MFEKSDHTFQLPVRISNITLDFTLATYHDVDHCKVNIVHARFERISKTKKKNFVIKKIFMLWFQNKKLWFCNFNKTV